MLGFVTRNWRLKGLALLLAVISWTAVVYAGNPPGTKTVQVPVPQPPQVSLPAPYVLTQPVPDLNVTVAGTAAHLGQFRAGWLQVAVDYSAISAQGTAVPAAVRVPVRVSFAVPNPNVQLDSPPQWITVQVDRATTRTVAVQVAISEHPPAGYIVQSTTLTPSTVTITGPEHELQDAVVRTGPIDLGNQEGNFDRGGVKLYAYDPQGRRLANVNTNPSTVQVQITVQQVTTSRTSPIVLGDVRGLAPGYEVTSISYTPPVATLFGAESIVNASSLASVRTAPLNVAGLEGTGVYTVGIPAPEAGVTVSPTSVTVTVTVAPIPRPTPVPTPTPTPTPTAAPTPASNPTPAGQV